MRDALELCQAILHLGSEEEVDLHAEKEMKRHYLEYDASQRKALATLAYLVNGSEYETLLEALHTEDSLENAGFKFLKPDLGENWDYNTPTKTLVLMGNGTGILERFSYEAFKLDKWDRTQQVQRDNVMIRGYISKFYYPQSIISESEDPLAAPKRMYVPKLIRLEEMWKHIRATGMVPFEIRVCAYTKTARYSYDIDMLRNVMLKDFRGGQAPLRNRASRTIIEYLNFDTVLASTDMKDLVKKAFINLFESEFATAPDLAHSMHITPPMAHNALEAIVTRGLAEKEGAAPREVFTINSEALAMKASKIEAA
jgi:hypothetical protein